MSDSLGRNVEYWTERNADGYDDAGDRHWAQAEITWGEFAIPESEVGALPDLAGKDVVEIGCGTAYFSAWLKRAGAGTVVGLDPTPAQLATADRLRRDVGPAIPLVRAPGEALPLRDASFDLAVSEYGAAIWASPYDWIPEAARVLRPGGELVFLGNSLLFILCAPDAEEPAGLTLQRDQRGLHRTEWTGEIGVDFHIPHGEWIRVLRDNGFEVLDLIELYVPDGAGPRQYIDPEWGRRWPVEEIWRARKR